MKKYFSSILWLAALSIPSLQATPQQNLLPYPYLSDNAHAFMTTEDVMDNATSGIQIESAVQKTVTGLYLQQLGSGDSCTNFNAIYDSSDAGFGIVWSTVTLPAATPVSIGANFLYNMVAHAITVAHLNAELQHPGDPISPGEPAQEEDSGRNWCIFLGVTNLAAAQMGQGQDQVHQLPGNLSPYNLVPNDFTVDVVINCNDTTAGCTANTTTIDIPNPSI
jgi:hypothetical protein